MNQTLLILDSNNSILLINIFSFIIFQVKSNLSKKPDKKFFTAVIKLQRVAFDATRTIKIKTGKTDATPPSVINLSKRGNL